MRKILYILFIILFVSTVSAQDYQSTKDRKVKDPETKELSEDDFYALELEAFMKLIQMPKTQERIKHTLETGKPLVN